MKTITLSKTILIITLIASSVAFFSCKGKKGVSPSKGATEINIPCSKEGRSDKNFFRADNSATSQNMSLSREKALTMAKQRLSGLVETHIKSVTDRYVNEYEVGDRMDFSGKFENLTREVINQTLIDVAIICEKNFQEEDGRYTTYIAIEVNKETLFNGFDSYVSRDEKLQVDYDKMKFEEIFNEEMENLAKERP
jgi:hypothetical protein